MTKLAILTYNEILTQLTVLYSTLYINTKKQNKKKKPPFARLLVTPSTNYPEKSIDKNR